MNKFITLHGLSVFWDELKKRIVLQTELATVAKTGKYSDLVGTPDIPSEYTLPVASATTLGGVKIGTGLTISSGYLSTDLSQADLSNMNDVTIKNLTVTSTLKIPGGKIYIE